MRGAVVAGWVGTLFALALTPRLALACSYSMAPPVEPDPALVGVDVTPPVLSAVRLYGFERGIPGGGGGCNTHSTFAIDADASDDLTPSEQLAFRVEALRGNPPLYYDEPIAYMYFVWEEEPTEPLDFELRIRAVDAAGNESNPLDIRITDGSEADEGGCSLLPAKAGATAAGLWVLAAIGWLRRRR